MSECAADALKLRLYDWVRQRIPEGAFVDMIFVAALSELVLSEVARAADCETLAHPTRDATGQAERVRCVGPTP